MVAIYRKQTDIQSSVARFYSSIGAYIIRGIISEMGLSNLYGNL